MKRISFPIERNKREREEHSGPWSGEVKRNKIVRYFFNIKYVSLGKSGMESIQTYFSKDDETRRQEILRFENLSESTEKDILKNIKHKKKYKKPKKLNLAEAATIVM